MTKDKNIMSRYAKKTINPKFYGTIKIEELPLLAEHKSDTKMGPGYVYAPYIPVIDKVTIMDCNGTRTIWQISRWKRFKLWFYGLIGKVKQIG